MKKYTGILLITILSMTAFAWSSVVKAVEVPANDNFANAQAVSFIGNTVTINSHNFGATREAGEPIHLNSSSPGAKSVWYKWTAAGSFAVELDLADDFGSIISVYTSGSANPTFAQLIPVSRVSTNGLTYTYLRDKFFANAGVTYYIVIDCQNLNQATTEGDFQLRFARSKLRYSSAFTNNGVDSIVIYRPSEGRWYGLHYWTAAGAFYDNWGLPTDKPIPADYDGNGSTDLAITRNENNLKYWYINPQQGLASTSVIQWGLATDKAVTGDFDRDGRADMTVIRKTAQGLVWYVRQSAFDGAMRAFVFGINTDTPVIGDFDGDGATDVAIARLSGGFLYWHILKSDYFAQPNPSYTKYEVIQFGNGSDIATPEDFDGDGKTDLAVFRPQEGNWYILNSGKNQIQVTHYGTQGDKPQPADYDGDGKTDLGVFRPTEGKWYLWLTRENEQFSRYWGTQGDIPVSSLNSLLQ
jgi:hypothetical protein